MTSIKNLPELENILETFKPASDISEDDINDIYENIYSIIDEYISDNILDYMYYDFDNKIYDYLYETVETIYTEVCSMFSEINISNIIENAIEIYFTSFREPRSYSGMMITNEKNKRSITKQINKLRSIPQPAQNTPDWYDFRWTRLTASAAWKALDSDAKKNELIYKKCRPIDKTKYSNVNINSATHHGHKFEPLSTLFYENMFDTEIEEFGCIPDEKNYEFGASPDGINVKHDSPRYGYLLEIKNPVSRQLTGIPKKEYWVQMQFQMHVTELHTCDFLETVFKSYDNEEEYMNDGSFNRTSDGKYKGIILCFHDGTQPTYEYPPWDCNKEEFEKWEEEIMEEKSDLTWIKNTYWRLQEYSCVTVSYNEEWFETAKPYFKNIWKTIEKERLTGYEHRKPKKRQKKPPIESPLSTPQLQYPPPPPMKLSPPKLKVTIKKSLKLNDE